MNRSIAYVCLQATREGQASYAHVHEIIEGLQRRGWACDLIEPWYARRQRPAGLIERFVAFFIVQVRFLFLAWKYDIVYVRDHPAALLAVLAAKMYGKPVALEMNSPYTELEMSYPWTRPFSPLLGAMFRLRARLSTIVLANTTLLSEWTTGEVHGVRVEVLPNGANVERFRPSTADWDERDYVVFIGVLADWQGVDTLLDAVRCDAWPERIALEILGAGALEERVREAAGSTQRVRYRGSVPHAAVPEILSGSLASLSAKSARGDRMATGLSPLKVYEAMAAGVPAIVSDIPDQNELVRGVGCGLVIPPDDACAVAAAVAQLDADRGSAAEMGALGREAAVTSHSWDQRALATDRLLRSIVG